MNPQIEKLEQEFIAFKNNPANAEYFFQKIWLPALTLSKGELKILFQKIYDWATQNKQAQPKIFALTTYSIAFINFHTEDYDIALANYGEAQKLFAELNDEDGVAICNVGFGGTYRTLGNFDLSLKYLLDAFYRLNKTHTYKIFEVVSGYGLAGVYLDTHNYERAAEQYKQTAKLAEKYEMTHFVLLCYTGLGDALHQLYKNQEALICFDKALAIAERPDFRGIKSKVLSDIGNYYFDLKEYDKAIDYNQQALTIRDEIKNFGGSITNRIQLAAIFHLQNKFDEAIEMLTNALSLAEQIKVKPKIFQIHLLLSEIYERKNELGKSLQHYKIYNKISDEVNKEDGEKKLKRSEMIFEAEQTKKENVIIKAQKQQIEKTNIELQKTIDELTLSKINRKAKTITTAIAIALLIIEDSIMHFVVAPHTHHNFLISLSSSLALAFFVKPIEKGVEHALLHRFVKVEKEYEVMSDD